MSYDREPLDPTDHGYATITTTIWSQTINHDNPFDPGLDIELNHLGGFREAYRFDLTEADGKTTYSVRMSLDDLLGLGLVINKAAYKRAKTLWEATHKKESAE